MTRCALIVCSAAHLLAIAAACAQGWIVYREKFDDNRNDWVVRSGKQIFTSIDGGAYRMTGLGDKALWRGESSTPEEALWRSRAYACALHGCFLPLEEETSRQRDFRANLWFRFEGTKDVMTFAWDKGANFPRWSYVWLARDGAVSCGTVAAHTKNWQFLAQGAVEPLAPGTHVLTVERRAAAVTASVDGRPAVQCAPEPGSGYLRLCVTPQTALAVEGAEIGLASTKIPAGWTAVNEGDFRSEFQFKGPTVPADFEALAYPGTSLSLSRAVEGLATAVEAGFPGGSGARAGVFLESDNGAVLRLEKSESGKIVFSVYSGGQSQGQREAAAPAGGYSLRLVRNGDNLRGEMVGGGQTITVGGLDWPGLPPRLTAGLSLATPPSAGRSKDRTAIPVTGFRISAP